jgi:hypothetical protein
MIAASRAVASAASRRSVTSLTAAVTRLPSSVCMADSEIAGAVGDRGQRRGHGELIGDGPVQGSFHAAASRGLPLVT